MQLALLLTQNPACKEKGQSSSLRNCPYLLVLNSAGGKLMTMSLMAMPKALWIFWAFPQQAPNPALPRCEVSQSCRDSLDSTRKVLGKSMGWSSGHRIQGRK